MDAKHQHATATVGESTADLGRFVRIKAPFCLFKLIVLSFFGIKQFINRYLSRDHDIPPLGLILPYPNSGMFEHYSIPDK
ncbi:MAG: hypothetical protein J6A79_13160 [Clostridia bacterium]|nr:hypothetical protein [Clostridia bacterium]